MLDLSRLRLRAAIHASAVALVVLCAGASLSCGGAAKSGGGSRTVQLAYGGQKPGTKEGKHALRVRQAELQEDLQRFAGDFMDRMVHAQQQGMEKGVADPTSDQILRQSLIFASSALDIATEPLPELGVLDMVVFLRLNRAVLTDYWVPKVLGERGQAFVAEFERAEREFWPIADKIMDPAQRKELVDQIDQWRRANPEMVSLEAVRFMDFAAQAGAVAAARAEEVRGLLASVKETTEAADEAILLGERGLFLANRMPFLLRLQLRVAGREEMRDAIAVLNSTESLTKSARELGPLVQQLTKLVEASGEAAKESNMLIEKIQATPTPLQFERLQHTLETANNLVVQTNSLVGDVRTTTEEGGPQHTMSRIAGRVDATMTRALEYLIAFVAASSLLWWGGYVLAKRATGSGHSHRAAAHG